MEELFRSSTGWVALAVEASAVLVIAFASAEAAARAVLVFFSRSAAQDAAKENVRLRLARWLALALELTLAADILRTAVAPSWESIGKLAAIAVLRTLLNVFLQREIEAAARHHGGAGPAGGPHAPERRG